MSVLTLAVTCSSSSLQAEEGFFSRKCRKINHSKGSLSFLIPSFINAAFADEDPLVQVVSDPTRHILYTRSEKGALAVYDMGADAKSMVRVASLSLHAIVQAAANIARLPLPHAWYGQALPLTKPNVVAGRWTGRRSGRW